MDEFEENIDDFCEIDSLIPHGGPPLPALSMAEILGMLSFSFASGLLLSTYLLITIPMEADRMDEQSSSVPYRSALYSHSIAQPSDFHHDTASRSTLQDNTA
jgi:hypothetical protein